ncbi:MAG: ABC transporter ATP-binding protein [Acidimicrobiales bacterium]
MSGAGDIRFVGVAKSYGETVALAGADLMITSGESVAVMGPSGSGKTTLALAAAGIVQPDAGQVWVGSQELTGMSERARTEFRLRMIGLVFQAGHLMGDLTAEENIALPLMFAGQSRRKAVGEARQWLEPLGLGGLGARRPGQLSGGQAQRVAIARAMVVRPPVLIADEPTGALDQETGVSVMEMLRQMCGSIGATLLVVTHDVGVAGRLARRIDVVDGRIVADRQAATS